MLVSFSALLLAYFHRTGAQKNASNIVDSSMGLLGAVASFILQDLPRVSVPVIRPVSLMLRGTCCQTSVQNLYSPGLTALKYAPPVSASGLHTYAAQQERFGFVGGYSPRDGLENDAQVQEAASFAVEKARTALSVPVRSNKPLTSLSGSRLTHDSSLLLLVLTDSEGPEARENHFCTKAGVSFHSHGVSYGQMRLCAASTVSGALSFAFHCCTAAV